MKKNKPYSLLTKILFKTSLVSILTLLIAGMIIGIGFVNDLNSNLSIEQKDIYIDLFLSETFEHVYIVFIISFIIMTAFIYITVKNSLKDVNNISELVKNINLYKKINFGNIKRPKEIDPLINSIQTSFEKIKKDIKQRKEFIDNAAHELNTPLAILRANIEGLNKNKKKKDLLIDLELIENTTAQLLRLSQIENFKIKKNEKVDLVSLLEKKVNFNKIYENETLIKKDIESLTINGNANYLDICFKNLIDNAIFNKKKNSKVIITIKKDASVEIINQYNAGKNNNQLYKNIFKKFWRADKNKYPGSGLGLSIVKRIVDAHNAKLYPSINKKTFIIKVQFTLI
tara:strand:+ start:857 stop:1885 length:1029 start_codon:yes stop_codon:yes gene_type:complete